jgi:hypothetical protein
MILKTKSNKPLFTLREQMSVIESHHIEHMNKATNVKEWNGYIDGVHHANMFGKKKVSVI